MKREIKFRAWDIKNKRMVYEAGDLAGGYLIQIYLDGYVSATYKQVCFDSDEIIIQQFTGLKDKNGVEIYEGDILAPNEREVIFIDNGKFSMGVGFYTLCYNPKYPKLPFTFSQTQAEGSEVIGNIYENPNLLKTLRKI